MAKTPNPALTHTFTLTIGDPSRDGHNMSDSYLFRCNKSLADVRKSHGMASKMYSMDLSRQCEEYEDSKFKPKFVESAKAAFHNRPDILQWECLNPDPEDEYSGYVENSEYVELYLEIAKLVDPELEWEDDSTNASDLCIGGYGLYSC